MAVIAPPRQPDSRDTESSVEPDRGGEALIEEAKQHAKRRRRRVAVTAIAASVAVAGAVTAALVAGGAGSSSSGSSSVGEEAEVPAVGSAEAEYVDLAASWAGAGYGTWVLIFSDGRVLRPGPRDAIYERVLSPAGLDLLRTGRVTAHDVYFDASFEVQPDASSFPDDSAFDRQVVWTDRSPREYVPTEFSACSATWRAPVTSIAHQLPNAVRAVVMGTARDIPIATFEELEYPVDWITEQECFVLNSAQVSAIEQFADRADRPAEKDNWAVFTFKRLEVAVEPLLPDGSVVRWGG